MGAICDFLTQGGVAQAIIIIASTIYVGFLFGKIKVGGISLGVTWILFVGIFLGYFDCFTVNGEILHFVKEFGLILFVYAIGSQVGASFFSSLRNGGLQMNLLAIGLICLNVLTALGIHFFTKIDLPSVVGLMSGAVTNTPGLGAAQQTFSDISGESASFLAAGYAIAYPMGVIGVIAVFIVVRVFCKDSAENQDVAEKNPLDIFTLEVQNTLCVGKTLQEIENAIKVNFVITRLYHTGTQKMEIPNKRSVLQAGDRIYVVALKEDAQTIELSIGNRIDMDLVSWDKLDSELVCQQLLVSKPNINGKSISSFDFQTVFGVNVSRVIRAGISLIPTKLLKVQVGDILVVVGDEKSIKKLELFIGNSEKKLYDHPFMIPIFLGIALGVIIGSIPFHIPGIPQPVKLGLAGGPLIVAILLNRFGTKLLIVTYATRSAMKMLQELGISLFLAAVGLSSGKIFFETLVSQGATWFLFGTLITLIPLITITLIGRFALKLEVPQLLGLLSGACTNPAALAFANSTDETGKTSSSYATVYPLTMLLRIMAAQFLILLYF
ncbi:MAG: putative transporter [Bacteroidales bacterium]|nr:putative transporter [Bacteroidales bacterium]